MTSYINFALQQIRQWAAQFDTHICLIAHPRKMPTDGGAMRCPTGYDIADSAAFFNKLMGAPIPKICLENSQPHGLAMSVIGKYDQIVQPWMFGDPFTKGAALWLKGLPILS